MFSVSAASYDRGEDTEKDADEREKKRVTEQEARAVIRSNFSCGLLDISLFKNVSHQLPVSSQYTVSNLYSNTLEKVLKS